MRRSRRNVKLYACYCTYALERNIEKKRGLLLRENLKDAVASKGETRGKSSRRKLPNLHARTRERFSGQRKDYEAPQ